MIQEETVVLYDTSKMGTPEHRAQVAAKVEEIMQQYPHLTRDEAFMLHIRRGPVCMKGQNSSGGGSYPEYCRKIGVPY